MELQIEKLGVLKETKSENSRQPHFAKIKRREILELREYLMRC
jgi:hypothetical protein